MNSRGTIHQILLVFCLWIILSRSENVENTLHIYDSATSLHNLQTFIVDAENANLVQHVREKRFGASVETSERKNITTKVTHMKDSRPQILITTHENVVICVARDPHMGLPSTVYISYDYSDSFENKTDLFKISDSNYATIDSFLCHPKHTNHIVFVDKEHKLLFITTNYGRRIIKTELNFEPCQVSFHKSKPFTFVALDESDPERKLWLTEDFGLSWKPIQSHVHKFFWSSVSGGNETQLYVHKKQPDGLSYILGTKNFFKDRATQSLFGRNITDVAATTDDFIFVTITTDDKLELHISYKGGPSRRCTFESELNSLGFYIVDVTGTRVMVAVSHSSSLSHLYVSEAIGTSNPIHFKLSLKNVFAYFPNSTWDKSTIQEKTKEAFVEVHKVAGLTGIYIATQIALNPVSQDNSNANLVSVITYDYGHVWQSIKAPEYDLQGQPTCTTTSKNCSLHLYQKYGQLNKRISASDIMSMESAPGILMATGAIVEAMESPASLYVSRDAGSTWRLISNELHLYNMSDYGSILISAKLYKSGVTRHIAYSTDEGKTWAQHEIYHRNLNIYSLMSEEGNNTNIFLFASETYEHQWIVIKVDLRNVLSSTCTKADYELRSVEACVMGMRQTFNRRIPDTNCYIGQDHNQSVALESCICNAEDFECNYAIPKPWPPGRHYNRTKGYEPALLPSAFKETEEFLIVADKNKITRINLLNNASEELPIDTLNNTIAVDFDMKNNCLYWADIGTKLIGRYCYGNHSNAIEILVRFHTIFIEALAFDWISNVLYYVDTKANKIEVIRTDVNDKGLKKRTIINSDVLKRPRGLAVHPVAGYIFWTDWDYVNPSVSRANMDGTNIKTLFTAPTVRWPNSVVVDYPSGRIYWADARRDYIGSSDLDGAFLQILLEKHSALAHPYSIAVFKDQVYWDDWKLKGVFSVDKNNASAVQRIQPNLVQRAFALKVFGQGVQEGTNACSNKSASNCEYMCLGAPGGQHVCVHPNHITMTNGTSSNSYCEENQFMCGDGRCIPQRWRCDHEYDCQDKSDELNCMYTCRLLKFKCNNGKCIPNNWRCDEDDDCGDRSDELECFEQNICKEFEFQCARGPRKCIPRHWVCDTKINCPDQSDEKNCTNKKCAESEYLCEAENRCIRKTWVCDGDFDCTDHSDEKNCTNTTASIPDSPVTSKGKMNCTDSEFLCLSDNSCVNKTFICDGEFDCTDHSDEKNCTDATAVLPKVTVATTNTCKSWAFMCNNGLCIPANWKCDGDNDCVDNSDERDCFEISTSPEANVTTQRTCASHQFQCSEGSCIFLSWLCDGDRDCAEGEDEMNCEPSKNESTSATALNATRPPTTSTTIASGATILPSNCIDRSDEKNCTYTTASILDSPVTSTAKTNWQTTANATDATVLPTSSAIETNVATTLSPNCDISEFACRSDITTCIDSKFVCDGTVHCPDYSDEENCPTDEIPVNEPVKWQIQK